MSEAIDEAAMRLAIDQARNQGHGPSEVLLRDPLLGRAYARYEQRLRQQGALDFGDLLLLPLRECVPPCLRGGC